jgi:hypothetical protein
VCKQFQFQILEEIQLLNHRNQTILARTTLLFIIFSGFAAQRGLWPPRSRGFVITHNDALQSVGLLWTSDKLVPEIEWAVYHIMCGYVTCVPDLCFR